jgi:hypothetical protein
MQGYVYHRLFFLFRDKFNFQLKMHFYLGLSGGLYAGILINNRQFFYLMIS